MRKQEKAAIVTVSVNTTMTVAKFILASLTGSVALLAEAYHSFADILSSAMVFTALRADRKENDAEGTEPNSEKQPDASEPRRKFFTPGNWENKVAIGIGVLLVLISLRIFSAVRQPAAISVRYPVAAAAAVAFLALCSYLVYRFEISVGKATRSSALIADGHHAQTDMLASALVVLALVGSRLGLAIDRAAAALIGSLILINAIYVLTQSIRSYGATVRGRGVSREVIYEDIVFSLLYRAVLGLNKAFWGAVDGLPWLKGPPEQARRKFGLALLAVVVVIAVCGYVVSGLYVLQPGERAIVERFGQPTQENSPMGPGLHYHWPWPVERVRKADVERIRRLTVGYKAGDRTDLILWTNIHYLREYSIITGEGPFIDVAMNVHYRIDDLFNYLYRCSEPERFVERISYQVLRETLGRRSFFSPLTTDRDLLENLIHDEIQRCIDEHGLGIRICNVCFRDIHPPAQVASAFEDVVSAQEDYETYIEEARGYRKDLLPRARADAARMVMDSDAYRNALVAESVGKAGYFTQFERAYQKAESLSRVRLVLEAVEESLAEVPKYVVTTSDGEQKPDLWLYMPSLAAPSPDGSVRERKPAEARDKGKLRLSSEEDLIEALMRFQQERKEEGR